MVKNTELNIQSFIQILSRETSSCASFVCNLSSLWILQPFGKCIKKYIIKLKWKEYSTALAVLKTHLTAELLFPSSIFQKFLLRAQPLLSTWRWTTPACGLRRIGKCKHTAVWQWPLTPGPWDHTHRRRTVCSGRMFDVPFKGFNITMDQSEKDKALGSPRL